MAKVMVPVVGFNTSPAGVEENVPPEDPVITGVGLGPDWQYVAELYTKEALSCGFTVMVLVTGLPKQPLIAGVIV